MLDAFGKVLGNRLLPNDRAAIVAYVLQVADGRAICGGTLEACCGAANLAEELRSAQEKQNPDKTDFSDAHLLADLVRVGCLPRVWLPPAAIRDLRS